MIRLEDSSDTVHSEITLPSHPSIQVDAAVWCRYPRSGCQVGIQLVMVLLDVVRTPAGVQLHPG